MMNVPPPQRRTIVEADALLALSIHHASCREVVDKGRIGRQLAVNRPSIDRQSAQRTQPMAAVSNTTRPKPMRYQANGTKSWLAM